MSANFRGQPPGLPAPVDVTSPRAYTAIERPKRAFSSAAEAAAGVSSVLDYGAEGVNPRTRKPHYMWGHATPPRLWLTDYA
eukprot:2420317-Prymnesium_polylepis.1